MPGARLISGWGDYTEGNRALCVLPPVEPLAPLCHPPPLPPSPPASRRGAQQRKLNEIGVRLWTDPAEYKSLQPRQQGACQAWPSRSLLISAGFADCGGRCDFRALSEAHFLIGALYSKGEPNPAQERSQSAPAHVASSRHSPRFCRLHVAVTAGSLRETSKNLECGSGPVAVTRQLSESQRFRRVTRPPVRGIWLMPELCAYPPCKCMVAEDDTFCGDVCAMLGRGSVSRVRASTAIR